MTAAAHPSTGPRCDARTAPSSVLAPDLERFWPSRRGHAFDELCRD